MIKMTVQDCSQCLLFLLSFQVVFVVQYFKKRPAMSRSPSDAGTTNTDEASAQMNHTMETSDKYIVTQVKHTFTFSNNTWKSARYTKQYYVCICCFSDMT